MIDWFDEQLGRITMYSLILYGLIALVVMAFVLMLVGNIDYSPALFAASVTILLAASYGSNRLFGWLFGVRPHGISALITGLILALLFSPPLDAVGYVELALVAAIAMASKYVLAPRGRHIFNPAAVAIVIASMSGIAYAGWWVATPAMIPLTLIVGALVLRRTKKQFISLAFVVVAVVSLLVQGTDPVTALVSWPILFVGAIMLSEPLTLPPRAWQQYATAAVVGVLMTLPLHYGRITMTPALALVIGNVIGWWFGQRRAIKLRYVGKKQMTDQAYDFTFDVTGLQFTPGQYIELSLPHKRPDGRGQRRIFSIATRPGGEQINIGTKIPLKPSSFKRALLALKPGDTLLATRVGGDFILPDDPGVPVVLIAGGIGITPYVSFIESSDRPMQLIYVVASAGDVSYVEQLRHHSIDVTVISKDTATLPDRQWRHIQGTASAEMLAKLIDGDTQPTVYISGPPGMVAEIRKSVKKLGIKQVRVDEFSGY